MDWIIHKNFCKAEDNLPEYILNFHTHGMEVYNHLDFQVVFQLPDYEVGRLLNTMGCWVKDGNRYSPGDIARSYIRTVRSDWI